MDGRSTEKTQPLFIASQDQQGPLSDSGTPLRQRRTTFILGEEEEEDEAGIGEADMQRLLRSVEHAARRVVVQPPVSPAGLSSPSVGGGGSSRPILGVRGDAYFEAPSPYSGETGMVNIRRPVYSQSNFEKIWEENAPAEDHSKIQFFDNVFLTTNPRRQCVENLWGLFPFLVMLKNYSVKKNLLLDIVSGITTGILRIPQSMAYALLTHLPPIFGLYTAFFSAMFYMVFGGSHHMAAGAQGVISLMVGAGVERVLTASSDMINLTLADLNNATSATELPNTADPLVQEVISITVTITFLVGVIQALLGIFRLGFITNYLSDPLIGGFTTGAACHVVISQLSTILGVKNKSQTGSFNMWKTLYAIALKIDQVNLATLLIAVTSLTLLSITKYINGRFSHKLKVPIPGELFVLVITIAFSYFAGIEKRWSVKVVGHVPSGFLPPRLPDVNAMASTWDVAFPAAIVSFAIGYSIAKRLALRNDYEINGNQEVFAFGFMNTASSFFGAFASTASMSASSLHESLGGKTQVANLIASMLVLFTLLFLGQIFENAPDCVLSTIILINLKSILSQFGDLKHLWILSKIDFLLWIVTWLAVVILDVDIGLGIGVAFSLLTIVFRTQWPYSCTLGRIPQTDIYKNRAITPNAQEIPGIKIYRFEGALYFASAEHFRNTLYQETGCNPTKILHRKRETERKLKQVAEQMRNSLIRTGSAVFEVMGAGETGHLLENRSAVGLGLEKPDVHHIIIDFSVCSFIDSVGVRTLSQVLVDYREVEVNIFLANVRAAVRSMLFNTEVFGRRVSAKNIFLSVHDAVLVALEDVQKMEERDFLLMDAGNKSVTRQVSLVHSEVE